MINPTPKHDLRIIQPQKDNRAIDIGALEMHTRKYNNSTNDFLTKVP